MIGKLSLKEVDQLIEVLDQVDRTTADRVNWRPSFDRLHQEYMRARRIRDIQFRIFQVVLFAMLVIAAALLVASDWDINSVGQDLNPALLIVFSANVALQLLVTALFPIVRRYERVGFLLRYFGADIPDEPGTWREGILPPDVAVALERLETASSPVGLRAAYETVEDWHLSKKSWRFDDIILGAVWLYALGVLMFGGEAVPEFVRGAAFMFVFLVAVYRIVRLTGHGAVTRRVEDALGRWRHLVPAMRETA